MTATRLPSGDPCVESIRCWESGSYRLELFATSRCDSRGCTVLAYEFFLGDELIFSGADFRGSPLHADDSDETLAALLGFLSLRPGDTDAEYFDGYTDRQLDFAEEHGEHLALLAYELTLPRIVNYYETWDEEALAVGDTDDKGEHDVAVHDEEEDAVSWAVEYLRDHGPLEPSSTMFHDGIWYSTVDDDVDIQTGDRTWYTFHLKGFTERQERAVYTALTAEGGEA